MFRRGQTTIFLVHGYKKADQWFGGTKGAFLRKVTYLSSKHLTASWQLLYVVTAPLCPTTTTATAVYATVSQR